MRVLDMRFFGADVGPEPSIGHVVPMVLGWQVQVPLTQAEGESAATAVVVEVVGVATCEVGPSEHVREEMTIG